MMVRGSCYTNDDAHLPTCMIGYRDVGSVHIPAVRKGIDKDLQLQPYHYHFK